MENGNYQELSARQKHITLPIFIFSSFLFFFLFFNIFFPKMNYFARPLSLVPFPIAFLSSSLIIIVVQ